MNNSDPGKIMRRARKKQGLTQAELAEKAGVSTMTIRRYESGDRQPRLEEALKISRALGLALKDLFSGLELDQMKHEVKQITITLQGLGELAAQTPVGREVLRYTSALESALPERDAQAAAGLIFFFVRLNEKGREKVAAYAEDLTRIGEYSAPEAVEPERE